MTEMENIRHFFERIAQYANDAGKEVASSAVPYSYVAQIGLTASSALKYIDALPNKHPVGPTMEPGCYHDGLLQPTQNLAQHSGCPICGKPTEWEMSRLGRRIPKQCCIRGQASSTSEEK